MLDDVPDLVPRQLVLEGGHVVDLRAQLDGVTETQTTLAFRAYTRRELDSAFDIGLS